MTKEQLTECAIEALEQIGKNTGQNLVAGDNPIETFSTLVETHGVVWTINSSIGTGMTHMGLAYFLREARQYCDLEN